ncbi:MAG: hypothetical protein U1E12_08760 [Hydrogenophaga sp.]|uniref:hypothetical protein n=1 Tax=Hydrogenophaga sp. TaxID=1904254 RepID=UPI002AB90ED9|nr:hypothetical protein [Hydrogenophaga sp.]MDZ4101753.1 hypothetical protein [Hydrogenophaga sp.]
MKRILVVCCSFGGHAESVARQIAAHCHADLERIEGRHGRRVEYKGRRVVSGSLRPSQDQATALDLDADFAALRETCERMDARCFPLHRSVCREPVDCDGVPAHWASVPQSLPWRTLFYQHGLRR